MTGALDELICTTRSDADDRVAEAVAACEPYRDLLLLLGKLGWDEPIARRGNNWLTLRWHVIDDTCHVTVQLVDGDWWHLSGVGPGRWTFNDYAPREDLQGAVAVLQRWRR